MDIKVSQRLLKQFLDTQASPQVIAKNLSLCGPTVDRLHKLPGDTVYDIEIITNRIDTASAFGIAREAAAILPQFNIKASLQNNPYKLKLKQLGQLPKNPPIKLIIKNKNLVKRFACISLKNVVVKPSAKNVQKILRHSGLRPLNNIIDISNELTLKYGQPVHVFDLDKIKNQTMIVRESRKKEKIFTLDKQTCTLMGGDIVIEDGQGNLIDLCGIMGGELSCIDNGTKNVLLFVQTYEPKHIRRTSLYLQKRTLASQIFEKSPDPELVLPVLIQAVDSLKKRASAVIASSLIDLYHHPYKPQTIALDLNWLNQFIGIKLKYSEVGKILARLGFKSKKIDNQHLVCNIPSWRSNDISIQEDLAEEIVRIHGFFRLPSHLPTSTLKNAQTDPILICEKKLKHKLLALNFTEIYNISLVSKSLFQKAKMDINHSLKLKNPLNKNQEYLRRSLIPSLLQNIKENQSHQDKPIQLFELANIYLPRGDKDLPEEKPILVLATDQIDFRRHKGLVESLIQNLNIANLHFKPLKQDSLLWNTGFSAHIYSANHYLGIIGKPSSQVINNFQIKGEVYLTNLDVQQICQISTSARQGQPLAKYPAIIEDITISTNLPIGQIIKNIKSASRLVAKVIYQSSFNNKHTFRIYFSHPQRNLRQTEVNKLKTKIIASVK